MRHGFLLIDKPKGMTSHDAVAIVRKGFHEPKIGHLGTLDPLATGLLVCAVGSKALKVIELFAGLEKDYEARIHCGAVSTTYDAEGVIEERPPKPGWKEPPERAILEALGTFLGTIQQTPPAHSAIHIDGKRAYEIIRNNPDATVALPSRAVTIRDLQLVSYRYPEMCIRVHCSSGTYIRSLAHDLGEKLRCGAYLSALRRTAVGPWQLTEHVTAPAQASFADVIPLKEILTDFPRRDLTEEEWKLLQHGISLPSSPITEPCIGWAEGLPVAILERDQKKPGNIKVRKVL